MQVNSPGIVGQILPQTDLMRLQVGQLHQVEILSIDANREGTIDLGGKLMRAKLDMQVQAGERFWVEVKEASENGIVLSKQNLQHADLKNLTKDQLLTLVDRGFGFDGEILGNLVKFSEGRGLDIFLSLIASNNPSIRSLMALWLKAIPQWSKLSGQNAEVLVKYFSVLGLDDENKLWRRFQSQNWEEESKDSVKRELAVILQEQANSLSKKDKAALEKMQEEITGQQLWIQSGAKKNAYSLMHLVLQNDGIMYQCDIAIESARQGDRMDKERSHIALQAETPNLGLVGADIIIFDGKINLCLLHEDAEELAQMVEKLKTSTKDYFAFLGFSLERIAVKSFRDYPYFKEFLKGKPKGGVDIQG